MSSFVSYESSGILVLDPQPSDGMGKALNNNFIALATHVDEVDPGGTNDATQNFAIGSRWYNTNDTTEFICTDTTIGAAVWTPVGGSGAFLSLADGGEVAGDVAVDGTLSCGSIDYAGAMTIGPAASLHAGYSLSISAGNAGALLSVHTGGNLSLTGGAGGGTSGTIGGGTVSLTGGSATGPSSTGGPVYIKGGTGSSINGAVYIQNAGGTTEIQVNSTGIGFFAATPVAQQAQTTDLRTALVNLGLISSSSGATPLNLNGGTLTCSGATAQHLVGGGTAPTIAAGTGAGTSPTISITGSHDVAGKISVTTGTSPAPSATIVTLTFNLPFSSAPFVVLFPANAATAALSGATMVYATSTTMAFVITSGSSALPSGTYAWNFIVVG